MPEILQKNDGSTNWTAIFAAFAAALVLILQQWQSYRIAEIQAQGEVNKANFMNKEQVLKIEGELIKRLDKLEVKVQQLETK